MSKLIMPYFFIVVMVAAVSPALVAIWVLQPEFLGVPGNTTGTYNEGGYGLRLGWGEGVNYSPGPFFNFHPLLMTMGYVLCASAAISTFKLMPGSHELRKYIHAAFHSLAVLFSSTSLYVIVTYKNQTGYPQFTSIHSWMGIFSYSAYLANFVGGLFFFIVLRYCAESSTARLRTLALPYHKFFGLIFWSSTIMAIISGVMDKMWIVEAFETMKVPAYEFLEESWLYKFPNFIGLAALAAYSLVVWVIFYTTPAVQGQNTVQYERLPTSDDVYTGRSDL